MYDSLVKVYYADESRHEEVYQERYNAPSSVHFRIEIRQFNHDKEYPAFFCYSQDMLLSLERIYSYFIEFLKILQQVTPVVQQQFMLSCIVNEVQSTSDIEGIHSTHRELRDVLDGEAKKSHFSSIVKMYDLLSSGDNRKFETCEDIREFYDEFNYMNAITENPSNRLDGVIFRKDAVDVKSPSGKTIHRGVEPESKIIETMTEALKFLNSDEYPVLLRIAVFHYLFVYIHPFYDGNGRTARFISSSQIAQYLHRLVALMLSLTIKKNKAKYYRILKETDSEHNCGDITPFICEFLKFIEEAMVDLNRRLRHKTNQLNRMKAKLFKVLPKDEDIQAMVWIILQSIVFYGRGASMTDIMTATNRTRNTVKSKLSGLPVKIITRHRVKYYKLNFSELRRLLKEIGQPESKD